MAWQVVVLHADGDVKLLGGLFSDYNYNGNARAAQGSTAHTNSHRTP